MDPFQLIRLPPVLHVLGMLYKRIRVFANFLKFPEYFILCFLGIGSLWIVKFVGTFVFCEIFFFFTNGNPISVPKVIVTSRMIFQSV